ncbi:hypothetical protein HOA55_03075 [archaeon]|nr:hypothetical protein [archaeon]MBT3577444.1 hypothetical protein [archaeon]MBT6820313.1 hypothetical protein [archaeon]MBT6956760.1 hypothetical protein [archaeon]MBT7025127.1 hypothetical protein [archaeon]
MGEGINLDEYCADPENKAQVISDLATIAMESFCRPAYYPCDIIDWVGEKILDGSFDAEREIGSESNSIDIFQKGDKEALDYVAREVLQDHPAALFALYMADKGHMPMEKLRDIFGGGKYSTACYGDYIGRLEERFGMRINEDDE